ncbi:hypothetical protein [Micromonospora sp. NPDC048830]|uniref:hypothetical protein n=1 Tax=Micromonospora sp. NPDC048830 TaxID=3364257 RepID=UPI003714499C
MGYLVSTLCEVRGAHEHRPAGLVGTRFTLKDVTAETWRTLSNPPDGLITPPNASSVCLLDVATCRKETADRINDKPLYARNSDWNPRPLPRLVKPISWPFLQQPIFRTPPGSSSDILNLTFVPEPPAGFTVKIYSVTYRAGVNLPPQFIAVAYPMDLDISKPPPFLVHFKHQPGQGKRPLFKHFDPLGYDWLAFEIWNWLVYNARRLPDASHVADMPFLAPQQFSFGLPYQLRQANKQWVLVLPHISRVFDMATGRLRDYQLYSSAMLRDILIEIQKDILPIKDDHLSHVAISVNSSGCQVVSQFLTSNVSAMKGDKAVAAFLNDELNELFVLDPPEAFNEAMIDSLRGWLKLPAGGGRGKSVRFYTHSFARNMTTLTGTKANPFTSGKNGFWESATRNVSAAYLPFDRQGNDVWQRTYRDILPGGRLTVSNFDFVHHAIPALCLTDAAARSLYV